MDFSPLIISLKTATVAVLFTFGLGVLAAWWVMQMKHRLIKQVVDTIFSILLVLPPTVIGFLLLLLFGVNYPLGKLLKQFLNTQIPFTWVATVIAAVVISFPLMYRSSKTAFESVEPDLINAGRTLGMSEWRIFTKVIFPNSINGVISGGILAFVRGLGEYGATAMIAGNIKGQTRTLPLAIYSQVASGQMMNALDYVLILIGVSFVAVLFVNMITISGRKQGK